MARRVFGCVAAAVTAAVAVVVVGVPAVLGPLAIMATVLCFAPVICQQATLTQHWRTHIDTADVLLGGVVLMTAFVFGAVIALSAGIGDVVAVAKLVAVTAAAVALVPALSVELGRSRIWRR